jgi:drug/metabolite transporter (DMT)-like permease
MINNATIAILIAAFSYSFYPLLYSLALDIGTIFSILLFVQITLPIISCSIIAYQFKSMHKMFSLLYDTMKLDWDVLIISILAGTGAFLGMLFFIYALEMMSKAGATLIMECWPLMAIIVTRALLSHKEWESFRPIDLILILMCFCGFILIYASEMGFSLEQFFSSPHTLFSDSSYEELFGVLLAVMAALLFAWAGVARSYFVTKLPDEFRIHYFGQKDSITEMNFSNMAIYAFGIPSAIIGYLWFEEDSFVLNSEFITYILLITLCLTVTGIFYSYSLLIAHNANINLLWYFAPVLAIIWLSIFGYSVLTPLVILGGFLIIFANIILILITPKRQKKL